VQLFPCVKIRDAGQSLIYYQSQLNRVRFGSDGAAGFHGKQTGQTQRR
jgi:hypothetical protein